jgi:hypothetical protein
MLSSGITAVMYFVKTAHLLETMKWDGRSTHARIYIYIFVSIYILIGIHNVAVLQPC